MQRVEKTMTWGKQELSNQELTGLCGVCLDEHLYRAAALGHAEIVNCLLKCTANPNKSREDYKTPACSDGRWASANSLGTVMPTSNRD